MQYLVLLFLWLLHLLPNIVLYFLSDLLYLLCSKIIRYRHSIITQNLSRSFPEKSKAEIAAIRNSFYKNFCDLLLEVPILMCGSENRIRKMVSFKNTDLLNEHFKNGESLIVLQGHFMNWELSLIMGATDSLHERYVIYKTLSDKVSQHLMLKLRERFNTKMLPMFETIKFIESHASKQDSEKTPAIFQFGADQTPLKHKIEYWTTFMNQECGFFLGPENLAKKFNLPLVYLDLNRLKRGSYEVSFHPLGIDAKDAKPFEITEAYIKQLEESISRDPGNWLWSHKRWKHERN